jgi:hypothetical protein
MSGSKNSIVELKQYLSVPDRPVSLDEFTQFWNSCTDQEKAEFKRTQLK